MYLRNKIIKCKYDNLLINRKQPIEYIYTYILNILMPYSRRKPRNVFMLCTYHYYHISYFAIDFIITPPD